MSPRTRLFSADRLPGLPGLPRMLAAGLLLVLASGCPGNGVTPPANVPDGGPGATTFSQSKSGLGFRLSDASGKDEDRTAAPVTEGTPLSAADAAKVLGKLPPLVVDPEQVKTFALRPGSVPAPRAGKTVLESFPPPPANLAPPATASGPLEVLRHAPEGDVTLAPELTVAFSQPMVPITSLGELAKFPPPVTLAPQPKGTWQWVGTQNALFKPEKRFPMATTYTVDVPAGAKSATGGVLARAEHWTFQTPPPTVTEKFPSSGPTRRDAVMFVAFDQAIDATAVLGTIHLQAASKPMSVRLATPTEIESDKTVRHLVEKAEAGRWLAFRASELLPPDTSIDVEVGPGTPSAEGPRTTSKAQSFNFATYGALTVVRAECSSAPEKCRPTDGLNLSLSNPPDRKKFTRSMVHVSPEVHGLNVNLYGDTINIGGFLKGRTTYTVSLDDTVPDEFGQTLTGKKSFTFDIGPADPAVFGTGRTMEVLDPAAKGKLTVQTVNEKKLQTRIYAVQPQDFVAFQEYLQSRYNDGKKVTPPGRLVVDKVLTPPKNADEIVDTDIDLSPALKNGVGQVVVIVDPQPPAPQRYDREPICTWIQVTHLGLTTVVDPTDVYAYASDLAGGGPLGGVQLEVQGGGSATTGADGVVKVPLGSAGEDLLIARRGDDVAILARDWSPYSHLRSYGATGDLVRKVTPDQVKWFVFDDRGTYKPKEDVKIKGFVRKSGSSKGGDLEMLPPNQRSFHWSAVDARNAEIAKGTGTLDEEGQFDLGFHLADTANLGGAHVALELDNALDLGATSASHYFQVQEFRRPEFEVNASVSDSPKGHVVGEHAEVSVAATYYAGGGLPDAPVHWRVSRSVAHITPPNRSDYTFGDGTFDGFEFEESGVSRSDDDDEDNAGSSGEAPPDHGAIWDAKTHADGKHTLRVDFDALEHPFPMGLHFSASVTDVNQQQWSSSTSLVVRPADAFVGMKLARGFVHAGDPVPLDVLVTDQDGQMVTGRPIDIELASVTWEEGNGFFHERGKPTLKVVDRCQATSTSDVQHCSLKTGADGGEFRLTAITKDAIGRRAETRMTVWAWGEHMPRRRTLDTESVTLIPDKEEYLPGQTAEVLLLAPFADGEALVTLRRQGVVSVQRATFKGAATTLHLPLTDALVPGVELAVEVVGKSVRTSQDGTPDPKALPRPAAAHGTKMLKVSEKGRDLTVTATPREARIEPSGATTVDVKITASNGAPVPGAEMSLVVVDEAILALSGMKLPDPAAFFYGGRSGDAQEIELRTVLDLLDAAQAGAKGAGGLGSIGGGGGRGVGSGAPGGPPPAPPPMAESAAAPAATASAMPQKAAMSRREAKKEKDNDADGIPSFDSAEPQTKMRLRTDFSALAAFVPHVVTGADGQAHVPVKLPDSLTRYRVMAVASAGPRAFGAGESTITARLPLMVRPSAPRFLNFGDRFDFPVVLQNQTDTPMVVKVAARADNATLEGTGGKLVTVPANDRVEVRLRAAAAKPGKARFQVGALSGRFADASEAVLPVWTPATTEAFATYGVMDGDSATLAQPMKMPGDAVKTFGDVEITTSSTALQALTDAFLYLVRYPYECDEQISSRIMGVAALRDVLTAFQVAGMPSKAELEDTVGKDITRLKAHQRGDGGWGYWVRSDEDPYVSIHVAHALARAKEKGFEVPPDTIARALSYLATIDQHIPRWYSAETRHALEAYALYTRARLGQVKPAEARQVLSASGGPNKIGMEPLGWLIPVMSGDPGSQAVMTEVRRVLANRVTETAGAAHFVTDYGDGDTVLLHSNRRVDGVLLEALIGDQPKSDLIPKLVTGLLGARKAGHWANTNEDAFVLLALDRYFDTYEKQTPDFVARAWLGDGFAGEHAFKGHTTERSEIDVPLEQFAALPSGNLTLAKTGPGRLYYRVGMRYAPASLTVPPLERGFSVSRTYEPVDDPADVRKDADGTWHIKRGAQVRIRVTMAAPAERAHVALVDPLPAGLEAVNPELAVSPPVAADPKARSSSMWWWGGSWYEHQNMRDERAEAFASYLPAGVYDYSYVARATTPGSFVAPPPKAEEMYNPETFGRGAGDKVVVE
jgi:uncharacterized protein YfaS (alpha-2-macroglobulin family)